MGARAVGTRLCVVILAGLTSFGADATVAAAQQAGSGTPVSIDRFIGAWKLVEWTETDDSGKARFPYGEKALGQVTYSSGGRMSAQLMRPLDESPRQHVSYWGRFSVDVAAGTVTHHVIGSSQEDFVGRDLVRQFTFEGDDRLALRAENHRLIWQRVR